MSAWYDSILERDWAPDALLRPAIRALIRQRLREEAAADRSGFLETLKSSPIALHTHDANQQHYEVPPAFFQLVLGPALKYSCCHWPTGVETLADAEQSMLELTARHAGIEDGQSILELGCGWGSLSLFLARRYPRCRITAVSNSRPQREFIEARAPGNLQVITADMNHFSTGDIFDRVVSVEMFEHMRNYQELLRRIRTWLKPDGALFVHIFAHTRYAYPFEAQGPGDWMAEHFFTGGIMPSDDLLTQFRDDLSVTNRWRFDGTHYEKTARAWLANLDHNRSQVLAVFAQAYGSGEALRWLVRWRVFFMAVEEVWAFRGGREWIVSHYLFRPAQ